MNKKYHFKKNKKVRRIISLPKMKITLIVGCLVVLAIIGLSFYLITQSKTFKKSDAGTALTASSSATQLSVTSIHNNNDLQKISKDLNNTDLNQIDSEVKKLGQ